MRRCVLLMPLMAAVAAAFAQPRQEATTVKQRPETADPAVRCVLEGVPKIGYGVHLCPFPGSLYAVMEYLGDPTEYDYLMGVTGAAFRRLWNHQHEVVDPVDLILGRVAIDVHADPVDGSEVG